MMSATSRPGYQRQDTADVKAPTTPASLEAGSEDKQLGEGSVVEPTPLAPTLSRSSSSSASLRNALLVAPGGESYDGEDDEIWTTTRKELWSFYAYYVGNSGLSLYNFAPIALQNLLTLAATTATPDPNATPRLRFAGSDRTVNSIVLLLNGISFAVQAFIFLTVGSAADFGRGRPWILIVSTVISVAVGFGWLGVTHQEQWMTAAGLYVVGLVGYQVSLTFWTSAFVGLARNLPSVRDSASKLRLGQTTAEAHSTLDVMERNRISNVAFFVCSAGELVVLAVIQGMLVGVDANKDTETNTKALTYVIAFASGVWALVALPWFVFEKHRPGLKMAEGMNILTAGVLNAWQALRNIWTLKQSLVSSRSTSPPQRQLSLTTPSPFRARSSTSSSSS